MNPPVARRADVWLEMLLLVGGLLILARIVLRGLWHPPVDWPVLPLAFGAILSLRVWRGERAPDVGGWLPGRWLGGVGLPALILAWSFLVAVVLLPSSHESLGPDAARYLKQSRDVLLLGRLDTQLGVELGATLLQAPFYLGGHAVSLALSGPGGDLGPDGTGLPYRNALRLGSVAYGFLAAILAWLACRRFFPPTFSAVCVSGVWLSSTLFHYSVAEPGMAHAPAAALASLLLLLWLGARDDPRGIRRWVALAFVAGLLVSTQRYDAYLLLPVALSGAACLRDAWREDPPTGRRRLLAASSIAGALGLALLPLLIGSFAFPGGFLLDPEVTRSTMLGHWNRPHVGEVLFSSNGGLFAWTPVTLLGTLGLFVFARRERRIALALLATLALGVVVLGSNPTWWGGWSFGARRLTEAFAIFALGFCAFAAAALRRPRVLGAAALGALVVVNLSLSSQHRWGVFPPGNTVSFTKAMQGVVADVYRRLGHPPSWPANWLFAARFGLGPDRFDDLYGQEPSVRWEVRLGATTDSLVLGRGWSSPYGEASELQRWAVGPDATLLFTLPAPVDRRLELHAAAAGTPEGLAQGIAVEVGGRPAGRLLLTDMAHRVRLVIPAALWSEGLNEVRFRPEWLLSRQAAWESGQPAYAGWRAGDVVLEPVELPHRKD